MERNEATDTAAGEMPERHEVALLEDLIRQSQDALIVRDFAGVIRDMNPAAEELYGYTIGEARGRRVHDLFQNQFPEGQEAYEALLLRDGHWAGEILQRHKDGSEIIVSSRQTLRRGVNGEPDLVLASNRDVSEQYRSARRLRRLFDSRVVGVIFWNLDTGKITDANDTFLSMVGYTREELLAGELDFRAMTPPDWTDRNEQGVESLRRDGASPPYEKEYFRKDGSRIPILIGGTRFDESGSEGFSFILDITERKQRETHERFLADLTERTRTLLDPEEILYEAAKAVGEYTKVHRALYIEIDDAGDTLTVHRDFVRADVGIPSMAGTFPLSAFGAPIVTGLRNGSVTQVTDTEMDPRLSPENRSIFRATHFQSFLAVPLHKAGQFVAVFALHYARPRAWTGEEAELLAAVMERTWLAVETARLFRETERRAEREALLNEIGEVVRVTLDPEAILQTTVEALGRRLGVDRCYFVRYDQVRNTGRVFPEWLRPGADLKPMAGVTRPMSLYSVNRDPSFVEGRTSIVNDTMSFSPDEAAPLLALNIRALMRVPIAAGNQMTALGVAMTEPRLWSPEDVRLVENVAALLRSSLASAHLQQRERNIAVQLQEALQPPAPGAAPGLSLASHYRPALAEASVGGDFFDVFTVADGRTALVVADLSGKGLAAASQVATVRNMLRYALYSANTLAEAVTDLHRILVDRNLLTGFATLFVGVYDESQRTLTYVNCGQEPGLIWRASSDSVERMPPTGPVLGAFGAGDFEEQVVRLAPGNVIALFTDGLTEVGPSRKMQLEIDGVSAVLQACCDQESRKGLERPSAQTIVDHLIQSVDDFARGGTRDDIALLVGIVT